MVEALDFFDDELGLEEDVLCCEPDLAPEDSLGELESPGCAVLFFAALRSGPLDLEALVSPAADA